MIHHMKTKGCSEMTRTICPWLPLSTCYQETQLIKRHTVLCSKISTWHPEAIHDIWGRDSGALLHSCLPFTYQNHANYSMFAFQISPCKRACAVVLATSLQLKCIKILYSTRCKGPSGSGLSSLSSTCNI